MGQVRFYFWQSKEQRRQWEESTHRQRSKRPMIQNSLSGYWETFQKLRIFNILLLNQCRAIFGSRGSGDQNVRKEGQREKKLSLQSKKGQAELMALATILHADMLPHGEFKKKIYFSHQLHDPKKIINHQPVYQSIIRRNYVRLYLLN